MMTQSREGTPQFTGMPQDFGTPNMNPFMHAPDALKAQSPDPSTKSVWEKVLPLFRICSVTLLLSFFILQINNSTIASQTRQGPWSHWANLASNPPHYEWSYGQNVSKYHVYTLSVLISIIAVSLVISRPSVMSSHNWISNRLGESFICFLFLVFIHFAELHENAHAAQSRSTTPTTTFTNIHTTRTPLYRNIDHVC
jgi:hypothetical protein